MSELKLPRLLAAAKEFNIGQDTLIDFLIKKGFDKDLLKPTAKLSEAMYVSLQKEFQSDKVARNKADQIEIPKVSLAPDPPKKKRAEDEITIEKVIDLPKEEIKPIVEQTVASEAVVEKNIPIDSTDSETSQAKKDELSNLTAPTLETPKIVAKIDLSKLNTSTRPKKSSKASKTAPTIQEAPVDIPSAENIEPTQTDGLPTIESAEPIETPEITNNLPPEQPLANEPENQDNPSIDLPIDEATEESLLVENISVDKLTGPKILGKIDLPVDSDTRPKTTPKEEHRKRKRIVLEKKQNSNVQRVDFRTQQNNTGSGGGQKINIQKNNQPQASKKTTGIKIEKSGSFNKDEREIDAKEIQDKIKETQAKLAGSTAGNKSKSLKAKHRRERKQEAAEALEHTLQEGNKLQVTEFVTVSELASLMDVSFTDVISKCMNLGLMVSINQRLDAEVIELVAGEFNYEIEFTTLEEVEAEVEEERDAEENLESRAPIVTIMGHVDHGKTSLLDHIRDANVVAGESGGITQHIGAYEVTLPNEKQITFLDTPGHEAFTAMRARGAKVTDIAVIVIAADDAVMPQTKEAISHAQAANVPMIFAVNKIDKDGANSQKIYEQLSQMNLLVESWGGKFQSQELSAKLGLQVDLLLEKILFEADLLDLKANPKREAIGTIIEASLDKGRGYVATILVQNGTLKQGDLIVSGQHYGKVKAMFNERNQRVQIAGPSTPVVILGLNGAPQAGEKFKVYKDETEAKDIATKRAQILREQGLRVRKHITLDEIGRRLALGNFKELNIIIKGDVDGSVEALSDSLQKLSTPEIAINVVFKAVGQISESDILLAAASDAILIGFNVRPSSQASKLAENEGVEIKQYSIIYKAIEEVKSAMEGMLEPTVEEKEVATVEIREVYKFDKATVAGSYVTEGKIKRDHKIRIFRDGILVFPRQEGAFGELGSLKRFKDDVKEVNNNYECGITIKGFVDIQQGDTVVAYEEIEIKRTL